MKYCCLAVVLATMSLPILAEPSASLTPELRARAVEILQSALRDEERWIKVHAAEALLADGYPEGVRETFEAELASKGQEPEYRIGIWRVLARATGDEQWVSSIVKAFLDTQGPDRLHAMETLAKLGYVIPEEERKTFEDAAASKDGPIAAFACCALARSGAAGAEDSLARLLSAPEPRTRLCAAYALRHLDHVAPATLERLVSTAEHEAADSSARAYMMSAAWLLGDQDDGYRNVLTDYARTGAKADRCEAAAAFGAMGATEDLPLLVEMLDNPETDVRVNAAHAILRIARRVPHKLQALDWLVIGLYAAAMVFVGWYYSKRTTTREDYLLGGRTMRPTTVGLSMFASLLSTLTYLAVPGEMVKHGPMIAGQYFVYPLTFVVIGWVLIPFIMRQKITSAYEILEQRLGVGTRLLGSTFFLLLRLLWMAVIIYATSSKVLVPLLGWPTEATPYICAVLGVITVVYTSMGGLRAVVMTDVAQTLILIGGAVLTLLLITVQMGGIGQWWPREWAASWDPPKFFLDPTLRVTIMGAMMSSFTWHVCTAGSDQVAIQRYLSTRNARSARKVVAIHLATDVLVGVLLAVLGLALFAYFSANPSLLPDGQQVNSRPDTLFPRFIVMGLPAGMSGLVVAGLLAAAMSSLSSGVNSACSVVSVDYIDRFGRAAANERKSLRRTKIISVVVGIVVVLLSTAVSQVGGNLLEVAFKVVNLLTAPLFVLFFMALFVPWATSFGAITAGIASAAMAIGIGHLNWFGLSFIWIMPSALITGIIVGPLASLLPIGRRKKAR